MPSYPEIKNGLQRLKIHLEALRPTEYNIEIENFRHDLGPINLAEDIAKQNENLLRHLHARAMQLFPEYIEGNYHTASNTELPTSRPRLMRS